MVSYSMSSLFSSPAPQPVPVVPVAPAVDPNAGAGRAAAEDLARRRAAAGRDSTIVGGMALAQDEQYQRGAAAMSRRAGTAATLG